MQREKFSSRLGFILISAGCAIGIGNVWRFPYVTGQYGGAAFVLIYLFFLVVLALPIMVMEFAVGRASQKSAALSFNVLEPKGTKWHLHRYFAIFGNYLLMMFYTVIGGWMLAYFIKMLRGEFAGLEPAQVKDVYAGLLGDPLAMTFFMGVIVLLGFGVCALGVKNGVEKITKVMMCSLLVIMLVLVVRAVTLPGAAEGLKFYLFPDFGKMAEAGIAETIFAAMGQAFFTLSIGIGSMAIFGSYIGKDRSLTGESISITVLDTSVALMAGLIIFPACYSFGVLFMTFAALSTVIAVFENLVSFGIDLGGWSRKKSVLINIALVFVLSLPCVLGFNVLSGFHPLGGDSVILDLEDFIVSNNLLPLGSLVYLLFCVSRYGWGFDKFTAEADTGKGIKFPKWARRYLAYVLPVIVLFIFVQGYVAKFF